MSRADDSASQQRLRPPRGVRLLEVAPDLATVLSPEERARAQEHLLLPTTTLDPGAWDPTQLAEVNGVRGEIHGFLLLSGNLTFDLVIHQRTCTRMIAPDELILLDGSEDTSLTLQWGWTILSPSTLAVLDDRLLLIAQRWPHLIIAILKRGAQQLRHALLQQAISQLPRVDERLLSLMWSIADRQGTVTRDGIHLNLHATQETLARMIGARRPTVSLGLSALRERGLLHLDDDHGWLINPDSLHALASEAPAPYADAPDDLEDRKEQRRA